MRISLGEEEAQGTVEYAIVTVAFMAVVLALGGVWRAGAEGKLSRLVERAASHGISAAGPVDAVSGAKDIALY